MQYLDMAWEYKYISHFLESLRSYAVIKIKIKKLDGDYKYFSLMLRTFFRKFVKCWKLPCEIMKNWVRWHILFNSQIDSPYIKQCMQTIKKILMWEVLSPIALNKLHVWQSVSHISYMVE